MPELPIVGVSDVGNNVMSPVPLDPVGNSVAIAVRPRAVYLIIPVPALAYLAAAILAGLIHDHAADTSHVALAVSAAQWIAGGFFMMAAATVLAMELARLATGYHDNGVDVYDAVADSMWRQPPAFPSGAGGLVSTVQSPLTWH